MTRPLGYLTGAAIAFGLLCSPLQAKPKLITFQAPGAAFTVALAIANSGQVTGYFNDPSGATHGFIRAPDGTFTTIDVPGDTRTEPLAISDDGTIVGVYIVKGDDVGGFIRAPDGQITEFAAPHTRRNTAPVSITNTGWIAGTGYGGGQTLRYFGFLRSPSGQFREFGDADGLSVNCANSTNTTAGQTDGSQRHGFVRTRDGTITLFDPEGGTNTSVYAINNSGTATGASEFGSIVKGFIRAAGGAISTFVASQDAQVTAPNGINKTGAIVGEYQKGDRIAHGFIRTPDGTITTIDVLGASETVAYSINAKGRAAGTALVNGVYTGFIWRP